MPNPPPLRSKDHIRDPSAIQAVAKMLGLQRGDKLVPGPRGIPFVDPSRGHTHFWIKRPGVEGEIHITAMVEHVLPPGSEK